ncbi:MAG: hypothetical protein JO128_12940 [Alphaproteobacteria bacterium]|nr:hypothetical protein [Alphaproteobacteria bacterium]
MAPLADFAALLRWIAATDLSLFIKQSDWAFPAIESVHVLALTLMVGTIAIVDLRLLGFASVARRYTILSGAVLPWTWGAFVVAVIAGTLMFISNPVAYAANADFRVKFAVMIAAGCNVVIFHLVTGRDAARWDGATRTPLAAKLAGTISLLCWIAVVAFGRRIGFSMALP